MTEPLTADEIQKRFETSPHVNFLGLRAVSADPIREEVVVKLPMRPEFERAGGTRQWHGGPIASAIDTVGDYALAMMVGRILPTINFRVDYLRPAIDTDLRLVARVRRAGRSIGVVDVELFDDRDRLVAIGRCTYSTLAE